MGVTRPIATQPYPADTEAANLRLAIRLARRLNKKPDVQLPDNVRQVIEAIGANVALLDETGNIVAANSAWRKFAIDNDWASRAGPGSNYLEACRIAAEESAISALIASALERVLDGREASAQEAYSLAVGGMSRDFRMSLSVLPFATMRCVLVCHYDLTEARSAENALRHVRQQLAIEEGERRRIARDLHDSTAQYLVSISLLLSRLGQTRRRTDMTPIIEEAQQAVGEALKEMRSFSYLLHPPAAAADGVTNALGQLIEGYSRRIDLPISFEAVIEREDLLADLQAPMFRIVQEALANVHRHASAKHARVTFIASDSQAMLTIEDDGRGVDTTMKPGVGMSAMKARAEMLGGTLAFANVRSGTKLVVCIPLPAA